MLVAEIRTLYNLQTWQIHYMNELGINATLSFDNILYIYIVRYTEPTTNIEVMKIYYYYIIVLLF